MRNLFESCGLKRATELMSKLEDLFNGNSIHILEIRSLWGNLEAGNEAGLIIMGELHIMMLHHWQNPTAICCVVVYLGQGSF